MGIKPRITENHSISSRLKFHNSKIRVEFKGSFLKQGKEIFTPENVVPLIIAYELDALTRNLNSFCYSKRLLPWTF